MPPVDPNSVQNIYSLIALIVLCLTSLCTLVLTLRAGNNAAKAATSAETAAQVAQVQGAQTNKKIQENTDLTLKIEKATNSMKDELVAATNKAGQFQGAEDERARAAGRIKKE